MWDECSVRYLRQLHQPHTVGILLDDAPGHFDRQSGLARPSDAGQGHQPRILQPRGNVDELLLAPDEAGHAGREVVVSFRRSLGRGARSHGGAQAQPRPGTAPPLQR